jgi:hypothetical protein
MLTSLFIQNTSRLLSISFNPHRTALMGLNFNKKKKLLRGPKNLLTLERTTIATHEKDWLLLGICNVIKILLITYIIIFNRGAHTNSQQMLVKPLDSFKKVNMC